MITSAVVFPNNINNPLSCQSGSTNSWRVRICLGPGGLMGLLPAPIHVDRYVWENTILLKLRYQLRKWEIFVMILIHSGRWDGPPPWFSLHLNRIISIDPRWCIVQSLKFYSNAQWCRAIVTPINLYSSYLKEKKIYMNWNIC